MLRNRQLTIPLAVGVQCEDKLFYALRKNKKDFRYNLIETKIITIMKPFTLKICIATFALIFFSCKKENPPKPPVISTLDVTEILTYSAKSGGNIDDDGGATITARGVCWGINHNPTIEDNHTSDESGIGTFTSNLTGLSASTVYYVRAYATNAAGTAYGQEISFKTLVLSGNFIDIRDNNEYKWVKLGEQVWMAENLAYLPSVSRSSEGTITEPYYYVYGYQGSNVSEAKATENYSIYGVLYNWQAAMNACPVGWHLPTDLEWSQLIDYLGGSENAGGKLKEIGTNHWNSPNTGATNESGFTALPGGCRHDFGNFINMAAGGYWWSETEANATNAWIRNLTYIFSDVLRGNSNNNKQLGFSVRCIKD